MLAASPPGLRALAEPFLYPHQPRATRSPTGKYESAAKLLQLVRHAESDAWLSLGLAFYLSVLPLTRQLVRGLVVRLVLSSRGWRQASAEHACLLGFARRTPTHPHGSTSSTSSL